MYSLDVLDAIEEAVTTKWEKSFIGPALIRKKLTYPCVSIIPDRTEYASNSVYNIFTNIYFYFGEVPDSDKYKSYLEDVEDTILVIHEKLKEVTTINNYKLINLENFIGSQGGNIVQGISLTLKVDKIFDFNEI